MHVSRILGAAGMVGLLVLVAGAPGAAALHDPMTDPLHVDVPEPTAVRMILEVFENQDYTPATGPVEQLVTLSIEMTETLTGDSVEETLAFAGLFQDRIDALRAVADVVVVGTDEMAHACPAGEPLPPVGLSKDAALEATSLDAEAFLAQTDPWTAAPGSFADTEANCRLAQALATIAAAFGSG